MINTEVHILTRELELALLSPDMDRHWGIRQLGSPGEHNLFGLMWFLLWQVKFQLLKAWSW